jgi:hypothetical protein
MNLSELQGVVEKMPSDANMYEVVTDIREATHIIITDKRYDLLKYVNLTHGKIYELLLDEDDYHVEDDKGMWNSVAVLVTSSILLKRRSV